MSDIEKLILECVGTFVFLSVILHSTNDSRIGPIGIAVALLAVIYLGASISGAHYNPAVTFAMMMDKKITVYLGISYIIAQLMGALYAFLFNYLILKNYKYIDQSNDSS